MLSSTCEETNTSKMSLKDFSLETVTSFLKYIYADFEWIPEQNVHKKMFNNKQITPELMKMCHMYEVKTLHKECCKYLKENICDSNAVGIWIEAERCEDEDLKDLAIKHIAKKNENISKVPGMDEAYQCPDLVKSLVEFYGRRFGELDLENKSNIKVKIWLYNEPLCIHRDVSVKKSDTVMALKEAYVLNRWKNGLKTEPHFKLLNSNDLELAEDRPLAYYGISDGTVVYIKFV